MLVDNAVVITESLFRHRQLEPQDPRAATLKGVREVGIATLAGTATAVVVFVPIVFGAKTQITIFLTHVALPIIVSMSASLLIAQTIVPMLAARFAAPPPNRPRQLVRASAGALRARAQLVARARAVDGLRRDRAAGVDRSAARRLGAVA